jgi:hypothetical protein
MVDNSVHDAVLSLLWLVYYKSHLVDLSMALGESHPILAKGIVTEILLEF